MTLRKTFEGDLKKMELTWGTAESEAKDDHYGKKEMAALSPTDRGNKRRKCSPCQLCENKIFSICTNHKSQIFKYYIFIFILFYEQLFFKNHPYKCSFMIKQKKCCLLNWITHKRFMQVVKDLV